VTAVAWLFGGGIFDHALDHWIFALDATIRVSPPAHVPEDRWAAMTAVARTANPLRVAVGEADVLAPVATDVYDLWSENIRGLVAGGSA
jgi:hypothetical protein